MPPPPGRGARGTRGKLFVGGISKDMEDDELKSAFEKFGEIVDWVVIRDRETRQSRGFGFVTFKEPRHARLALDEMNGKEVNDKPLHVTAAEAREGEDEHGRVDRPRNFDRDNRNGGGSDYRGGDRYGRPDDRRFSDSRYDRSRESHYDNRRPPPPFTDSRPPYDTRPPYSERQAPFRDYGRSPPMDRPRDYPPADRYAARPPPPRYEDRPPPRYEERRPPPPRQDEPAPSRYAEQPPPAASAVSRYEESLRSASSAPYSERAAAPRYEERSAPQRYDNRSTAGFDERAAPARYTERPPAARSEDRQPSALHQERVTPVRAEGRPAPSRGGAYEEPSAYERQLVERSASSQYSAGARPAPVSREPPPSNDPAVYVRRAPQQDYPTPSRAPAAPERVPAYSSPATEAAREPRASADYPARSVPPSSYGYHQSAPSSHFGTGRAPSQAEPYPTEAASRTPTPRAGPADAGTYRYASDAPSSAYSTAAPSRAAPSPRDDAPAAYGSRPSASYPPEEQASGRYAAAYPAAAAYRRGDAPAASRPY